MEVTYISRSPLFSDDDFGSERWGWRGGGGGGTKKF